MKTFHKLFLVSLVASMTSAAAHAGGGSPGNPDDMFGGLEQSAWSDTGRSRLPQAQFSNPFDPSGGFGPGQGGMRGGPGGPRGGFGPGHRGEGRGPMRPGQMRHHGRRNQENPLLSPRTAMYWYRLDANSRAQLENYFRQWIATLTTEQQTTLITWIQSAWERMPRFQQMFLSTVFTPVTSAASAPTSSTTSMALTTSVAATPATTTSYDPTTGFPIDPSTGYPVDPATGYLVDPASGYRYDRVNGLWIDPTTGQAVTASQPTTTTTSTTAY